MNPNSKIIAAAVAAAIGATAFGQAAVAETAAPKDAMEVAANSINVPATGVTILDSVHAARLALFDGDTDKAKSLIESASGQFDDKAAKFAMKLAGEDGYAIPVDSGLQFADGFQPTDAHTPVIAEAGIYIQQGDIDTAVTVMTEGGVELNVAVVALPVKAAVGHLKQALADIDAGHFHKANMALKGIETSIVVEDFKPGALPKQGYPLNDILQG